VDLFGKLYKVESKANIVEVLKMTSFFPSFLNEEETNVEDFGGSLKR
jgi:hypothetical protein